MYVFMNRRFKNNTYNGNECKNIVFLISNDVWREFFPVFSSNPYCSGSVFFGSTTPPPKPSATTAKWANFNTLLFTKKNYTK